MDAAVIILIILIVLITIIAILIIAKTTPSSTGHSGSTAVFNPVTVPIVSLDYWSGTTGTTGVYSSCNVFYFQGVVEAANAVPMTPTLDPNIIENCLPVTEIGSTGATGSVCFGPQPVKNVKCLDPDQIAVIQKKHTCAGTTGTNGLGCRGYDGVMYPVGETVEYFSPCSLQPCTTTLGSIALNYVLDPNFVNTYNNMVCLEPVFDNTGAFQSINASKCTFGLNQMWRIVRANINSAGNGFTQNATGKYAYIQNRETGQCLIYNPPSTPMLANKPTLGQCGTNQYPWLLVGPYPIGDFTTPPQLTWVGAQITPINNLGDLLNFINSNDPQSLYYGNVFPSGTGVYMQKFQIETGSTGFQANYLDYSLFNFILQNQSAYPLI